MIDSISNNALAGMQSALDSAGTHASEIANAFSNQGSGDIVSPAIGLIQDKLQFEASTEVVKVAKNLSDSLLDVIA